MLVIVWCYLCCCFNYCCFFQKRSGLLIMSSSSSLMATFWASCSSCIEEWSRFCGDQGLRCQKPRVWWKAGGISSLHIDIQTKFRIRESTLEMFQLWSTTATPSWRRLTVSTLNLRSSGYLDDIQGVSSMKQYSSSLWRDSEMVQQIKSCLFGTSTKTKKRLKEKLWSQLVSSSNLHLKKSCHSNPPVERHRSFRLSFIHVSGKRLLVLCNQRLIDLNFRSLLKHRMSWSCGNLQKNSTEQWSKHWLFRGFVGGSIFLPSYSGMIS